jgi:hypothetical protein
MSAKCQKPTSCSELLFSNSKCEWKVRWHEYALGIFPVIQFSFPDSPRIFPVLTLREIFSLKSSNFPVFSRKTGKRRSRDEFADDCPHRQQLSY